MHAEFGDGDHPITETKVEQQFGLRWDEGDDALRKIRHLDGAVHLVNCFRVGHYFNLLERETSMRC